jgi:hypothetical protein
MLDHNVVPAVAKVIVIPAEAKRRAGIYVRVRRSRISLRLSGTTWRNSRGRHGEIRGDDMEKFAGTTKGARGRHGIV